MTGTDSGGLVAMIATRHFVGRFARLACLVLAVLGAGTLPAVTQQAGSQPVPAVLPATAQVPMTRIAVPITQPWLNGLSSIHTTDGERVLALSNQGFLAQGRLERDRAGRLTGVRWLGAQALGFGDGRPLTNGFRAAEGLAVAPDGRIFVSFEYHNRVWTYRQPGAPAEDLGAHVDFGRLRHGRGFEALALAPDGALYAIPERPARMTHGFPSYRWQNGQWYGAFRMPADGPFLPVSADFGPDGLLYVLEFSSGSGQGAQSQIRRFQVQGDAMGRGTLVLRTAPGQFGRLSGLSIWRNRTGQLRATLVSDNGGMADRPAELVEMILSR